MIYNTAGHLLIEVVNLSPPSLRDIDVGLPQNHLDAESVSWLQNTLAAFPGTVVAVTHDRYFLDSVAGWILELDQGKGESAGSTD